MPPLITILPFKVAYMLLMIADLDILVKPYRTIFFAIVHSSEQNGYRILLNLCIIKNDYIHLWGTDQQMNLRSLKFESDKGRFPVITRNDFSANASNDSINTSVGVYCFLFLFLFLFSIYFNLISFNTFFVYKPIDSFIMDVQKTFYIAVVIVYNTDS